MNSDFEVKNPETGVRNFKAEVENLETDVNNFGAGENNSGKGVFTSIHYGKNQITEKRDRANDEPVAGLKPFFRRGRNGHRR